MTDQLQHQADGTAGSDRVYDGFISYSHAADGLLAPRLQSGLQRFAKPWWKRRAVRIFRDESSLSANPHLWSSITEALDSSGWFVLLLSPDAANSEWVNQEIAYWKTNRDPSRILPVVTDGEFGWADGDVTGDAVSEQLRGVFAEEPRWVDLRFARGEEQLDLKNPRFSAVVADIASALRGVPKDELESEEVRQHRNTIRTAWAAGGLVTVLAIAAVGFGIQSSSNAAEAERQAEIALENEARAETNAAAEAEARAEADDQRALAESAEAEAVAQAQLARSRELATESIALVERDPELATLLALYAWDAAPPGARQPAALSNALWTAVQANRLVDVMDVSDDGPTFVTASDDGRRVFVSSEFDYGVRMFDEELNLLWDYTEETTDSFTMVSITPDGSMAAVGVPDASSLIPQRSQDDLGDDGIPNRVIVFDGEAGAVTSVLEYPDCVGVEASAFSPDGRFLAVNSGLEGCSRGDSRFWVEIYETAAWQPVAFIDLPTVEFGTPIPEFAPDGRLFLFDPNGTLSVFAPETFEPTDVGEVLGMGDIIGDGSRVVATGSGLDASVVDVATGGVLDRLGSTEIFVSVPLGIEVSPDGRWASVGTFGTFTSVFELSSGERIHSFATGHVLSHSFDPVEERLYTSHADGTVKVWDLGTSVVGVEAVGDLGAADWVQGNSFSLGEEFGAFAAGDLAVEEFTVRFFYLESGELLDGPALYGSRALPLGGERFAVELADSTWAIHDAAAWTTEHLLGCPLDRATGLCADTGEQGHVFQVVVASDRSSILAFRADTNYVPLGEVIRLDPQGNQVEDLSDGPLASLQFHGLIGLRGDTLFYRINEVVNAVDIRTGEVLLTLPVSAGSHELSGSSNRLAVLSAGVLQLVETDSLEVREIDLDIGGARGMEFSPDESSLAIGAPEGLVIVDLERGAVAQTLAIPGVSDAHWIEEVTLLIGTNDGVWGTVSIDSAALVGLTRETIRRSFTSAECVRFAIGPCPSLEEMRDG